MHHFEVVDSELLVDAPILALRRDQVHMPAGNISKREIVEHFGAVAIVAVDDAQRIALVHQYRHSVQQKLWELPAGLLDMKDEDALLCAQRELQEEAGVSAGHWAFLLDLVTSPGFCEEVVRVFLAGDLSEVEQPAGEDEEADMQLEWVPLDRARAMVMEGKIINSIAIAGIMAAAEVLSGRAKAHPTDTPFPLRPTHLAARRKEQDMKRG